MSGTELVRLLDKADFVVVRQKGSHLRMRRERDGKVVTVPMHPSRDIDRSLLHKIITVDIGWTREYFMTLYDQQR
ncbi:MAG TPA: type II toxin-antitoxin system HicA family toxin [Candidatus Saccharimonadales bacterium]|jgi:predicted RNA binding protein YcfA (HicA-like mRNA interferase family)